MLHLEYWFSQEAFRISVVAAKGEHFTKDAASRLALDMDHEFFHA